VHDTGILGVSAHAGVYVIQVLFDISIHICEHTRCRECTCVRVCTVCLLLLGDEDGQGQLVYEEHLSLGIEGCF